MNTVFALSIPMVGELQRRGWFPGWLALVLLLAAVVAVGWLYAHEAGRLSVPRRLMLATVRMLTVIVVAFLLLRPVVVQEKTNAKPRPIALLIDVSQSMNSADPRPTLPDQWRAAMAFGFIDPDKPFPNQPISSIVPNTKDLERPTRLTIATRMLRNEKLDLLNKLRAIGPLEIYTFGITREGHDPQTTEWLASLRADQPRTALVNSTLELLNRDDNELPTAIVLVTDGRDNASDRSFAELAAQCRIKGVPLHIYGVGSTAFGQLRLRETQVPETIFLDDGVAIPIRYAVRGITEGRVDITVLYGDPKGTRDVDYKVVAEKTNIPVQDGDDVRETLTFVPTLELTKLRKQDVTVEIKVTPAAAPGGIVLETLTDSLTKPTQIITKKLKVLMVDGLPRFDFRFLQRALLRDRRVEARFFLTEGDREAMKSGYPWLVEFTKQLGGTLSLDRNEFRKILYEFDLLILGDVPGKFFTPEQQQIIKEFVADGGGLLHIAGRWNAPRHWLEMGEGQPSIADVLPVELRPEKFALDPPGGRYFQPFVPVIAPHATRHPLVMLEDDPFDNADLWGRLTRVNPNDPVASPPPPPRPDRKKQLSPLEWYYPVVRLKPGAEVFLIHPTARTPQPDNKPMPLLAGHYFGKGYVLFCAFDDTWRWRYNEADKYFGRFWSQAVYQAGVPRMIGTKRTQLLLNTPEPIQGGSGQVYARLLDENFQPLSVEDFDATLERLDAAENDRDRTVRVKFRKLEGQNGEYIATLLFQRDGRYRLTVDAQNKSPATLEYRVSLPPNHELAPGGMAEADLRKLAEESSTEEYGGKFYREEDLHTLPETIVAQSAPTTRREEKLLWNAWIMGLLIGLLALEWFLRKFNGLS
ncbi:MAG: hypothetical protein RMJ56_14765 [Gemmataceae bacterium]|nr:hypothetical protein [Gemmata sp.]MDW8198857.1 hypothetical protein [Gemmataceae bacterium]